MTLPGFILLSSLLSSLLLSLLSILVDPAAPLALSSQPKNKLNLLRRAPSGTRSPRLPTALFARGEQQRHHEADGTESGTDCFLLLCTGGLEHVAAYHVATQLGIDASRSSAPNDPAVAPVVAPEVPIACGEPFEIILPPPNSYAVRATSILGPAADSPAGSPLDGRLDDQSDAIVALAPPIAQRGVCSGEAGLGKLLLFLRRPNSSCSSSERKEAEERLRAVSKLEGIVAPMAFVSVEEGLGSGREDDADEDKDDGLERICALVRNSKGSISAATDLFLLFRAATSKDGSGSGGTVAMADDTDSLTFRASVVRDGRHPYNAVDLMRTIGGSIHSTMGWKASMKDFDIEVGGFLALDQLVLGLLLPSKDGRWSAMKGNELPVEGREYLDVGERGGRLRPSTAVLLLALGNVYRLAAEKDGNAAEELVVLDAMGGIGTIALEAAATIPSVRAFSTDIDEEACEQASRNVASALEAGALAHGSHVTVDKADARNLCDLFPTDGAVDAIVVDMPFGRRFKSELRLSRPLELTAMLEEFARLLRRLGPPSRARRRAVMLSSYGWLIAEIVRDDESLCKKFGVVADRIPVNIGGIAADVTVLERM